MKTTSLFLLSLLCAACLGQMFKYHSGDGSMVGGFTTHDVADAQTVSSLQQLLTAAEVRNAIHVQDALDNMGTLVRYKTKVVAGTTHVAVWQVAGLAAPYLCLNVWEKPTTPPQFLVSSALAQTEEEGDLKCTKANYYRETARSNN